MKKILIASALMPVIEQGKSIFSRADFRLFFANSGEEALAIHRAERMDVIVADLDMPGINGDRLCSIVRDDDELKKVFVILIGTRSKSDLERCLNSGANSYLTNPINTSQLTEELTRLLNVSDRKSFRVLVKVEVKGKFMNTPFFSFSLDLSISGILVETEKPLAKGDVIACSFFLPDGGEHIFAEGEVMRVVKKEALKPFQYGIRFLGLKPEFIYAIEQFVKNRSLSAGSSNIDNS